jgi:predicted nuclease with TOPRIM domain
MKIFAARMVIISVVVFATLEILSAMKGKGTTEKEEVMEGFPTSVDELDELIERTEEKRAKYEHRVDELRRRRAFWVEMEEKGRSYLETYGNKE